MSDIGAPSDDGIDHNAVPLKEQEGIKPVDDNDVVQTRVEETEDKSQPGKPVGPAADDDKKSDPRADRMEQLAEKRQEVRLETLTEIREAVDPEPGKVVEEKPAAKDPTEIDPDTMVRTKVRGVEKIVRYGDVISGYQKTDAADSYLADSRALLEEAKKVARPAAAPVENEKVEPPEDRLAKAIDVIQIGGDPKEARAILDEELNERATRAARSVVDERSEQEMDRVINADVVSGFAAVEKDYPHLVADKLQTGVLLLANADAQREEITNFLANAPDPVREAFASANITAEGLGAYTDKQTLALYRDMVKKNYGRAEDRPYGLRRPSELTKEVAVKLAERFPAPPPKAQGEPSPTPAANGKIPVVLDRTARKEAIQQPERTTIPRPTPGRQPAPLTPDQRAQVARDDLRAQRRKGVTLR